jgi:hypothetical protein
MSCEKVAVMILPFLITTTLVALSHFDIERQHQNEISIKLLVQSAPPTVQLLAITLFQRVFNSSFPIRYPLDVLITTLIAFGNWVRNEESGVIIDLLFRYFPDAFLPPAETLTLTFLRTWMCVGVNDDSLDGIDLLLCVRGLIDPLPFDSDIFANITEPLVKTCWATIVQNPSSHSEVQLLDILTSLVKKTIKSWPYSL